MMKNTYETHGALTIIHIKHQEKMFVTFIDTEDLEKLLKYPGTIGVYHGKNTYYAYLVIEQKRIDLHRFLMGLQAGDPHEVDHKNNNGLDNRRSKNLRFCTHSQNMQNIKPRKDTESGCLNVYYDNKSGKWQARIVVNGKIISGGRFRDIEKAKQAAIELRKEYFPFSKEAIN